MTIVIRNAIVILALAGTVLASGCVPHRDWQYGRSGNYRGDRNVVSRDYGNVAFGYRDGYWDNGHNWHQWGDDRSRQGYQRYKGNHYNDWNHDRDGDDGWRRN